MSHIFNLDSLENFSDKINLDDLYEKKRRYDLNKLDIFNKLLARVHNKIKITARLKFPSIENLIELIPRQTPAKGKIFGSRYLDFFDETNLNFLFSSIIQRLINFLLQLRFG